MPPTSSSSSTVATAGTGSPGLSLVPPGLGDFYASEIEDYAFDIDEAQRDPRRRRATRTPTATASASAWPTRTATDLTFRFNYPD